MEWEGFDLEEWNVCVAVVEKLKSVAMEISLVYLLTPHQQILGSMVQPQMDFSSLIFIMDRLGRPLWDIKISYQKVTTQVLPT